MEIIIEKLENLIDDMERDSQLTRNEVLNYLKEIKSSPFGLLLGFLRHDPCLPCDVGT